MLSGWSTGCVVACLLDTRMLHPKTRSELGEREEVELCLLGVLPS